MTIIYNDVTKDLPSDQLHVLFMSAGWIKGAEMSEMRKHFNLPFINSTLVVSAWENERLIGVVRVLSDQVIRSVIYDLVVLPACQNRGIGRELVKRCIAKFPNAEWLVQTTPENLIYYEKIGFNIYKDVVLTIPSKYQT